MQPIAIFAAAAAAFLSSVPQVSAHTRFPECKNLLVTPAVKIPAPGYDPSIPMVPSGPLVKQQFDTTVFSTSPIPTDPSSPHYKYAVMISNMMVEVPSTIFITIGFKILHQTIQSRVILLPVGRT
ncbi:hypothetical protein TWF788_010457 [Orbilia oligospora]|uniref:Uncharacterized protein n=1 Tax=Orbilia oligospora TaxID=2813651 RepID=A0A7C8PQ63_ORBOL|nr:hypothetical protein TWF788_010457 [Orbilia oligospora]